MGDQHGGKREGAGRKKGSKNKMTIAREVVAEIIEAPDPSKLAAAIHQRGYMLLLEMERIALDPSQPLAARIMAAKTALPFMLPKQADNRPGGQVPGDLVERLQAGRSRNAKFLVDARKLAS
jgi:hypothetical protein